MSNIDHVTTARTGAKAIEQFGGSFKTAPLPSRNVLAQRETETPGSEATEPHAKSAPSVGRPPLFRR